MLITDAHLPITDINMYVFRAAAKNMFQLRLHHEFSRGDKKLPALREALLWTVSQLAQRLVVMVYLKRKAIGNFRSSALSLFPAAGHRRCLFSWQTTRQRAWRRRRQRTILLPQSLLIA